MAYPLKTYKTEKGVYEIPEKESASFLKDFPNAMEVVSYKMGKDTFDIPVKESQVFLKENPQATPLKKKEQSDNGLQEPSAGGLDGTTLPTITQDELDKQDDVIGQIQEADALSKKTRQMGDLGTMPDLDAIAKSKEIHTKLKGMGYGENDIEVLTKTFSDLPKEAEERSVRKQDGTVDYPYSKKSFLELYKSNPIAAITKANNVKNFYELRNSVGEAKASEYNRLTYVNDDTKPINANIDNFNQLKEQQKELINTNLPKEKRQKAIDRVEENSDIILSNIFQDENNAKNYLIGKLQQKDATLKLSNPTIMEAEGKVDGDLSKFSLESIADNLDPKNKAEKFAFRKYKYGVDLDNAINNSADLNQAALTFAAEQNPQIKGQLEKLGNTKLPNAYEGEIVNSFLNSPDVIRRAEQDPEFANKYEIAKSNLYFNYPDFAKKEVATKISQGREDAGLNNWFANVPTKEGTDKLVDKLVQQGKMTEQDKLVYQTQIRDDLGVWESIKRGTGRTAFGAFVEESPIQTPGLLETTQNAFNKTIHGVARSVEDVINVGATTQGGQAFSDKERLYNKLQEDASIAQLIPKGTLHEVSMGTGNLMGFVIPMMAGGAALKGIKGGEFIANGLMFEGENKDNALKLFPDDPTKQFAYTAIATAGDMMLGHLIPKGDAAKGISKTLKGDIVDVVNKFTNKEITAAEAKKTLLNKTTGLLGDLVKENTKVAGTITGFGVFHNTLDALFGANDMGAEDIITQSVKDFKSNFLTTPLLAAMSVKGKSSGINGKVLMEVASNQELYKKVITEQSALNPELKSTESERLSNLEDAASIKKDLDKTEMTAPQKEKYMIEALNKKILERKASGITDKALKQEVLNEAEKHDTNLILLQSKFGDKDFKDLTPEEKETIEVPKGSTVKTQPSGTEGKFTPLIVNEKGEHEVLNRSFDTPEAAKIYGEETVKRRFFDENIKTQKEDTTKTEEELPNLSVPIEGTDKKGIPIGEDVPKPTDVVGSETEVVDFDLNEIRKPNGKIGEQGFTEEGARDLLSHIGIDVKGMSLKEMVDHLKANPADLQKLLDFTKKNPIELQKLPDGSYDLKDGNHRANLLYHAGIETVPTVIKDVSNSKVETKPYDGPFTGKSPSENKPILNEEPKAAEVVNAKEEGSLTETKPIEGVLKEEEGTGEPPKPPKEPVEETGGKDRLNDKGILNHLVSAENVPEASKKGFEEKGLKYNTSSQKEAESVAKSVIDKYGLEDAVLLAEAQKFDGDVNSLIYAETLNRLAKAEAEAKTPEEKIEFAKKFAEVGIKYDEAGRKGGRFSSAINYFYKKSPLGIQMIENAKRKEAFEEWSKPKDKSWKEFFDEMMKEPDFEVEVKKQVKEELKKERSEARKTRIKKVDEFFDDAIKKFKDKGATYSTVIPPKVITTALEGMKLAYRGGEKVAKIIQDAVDYISEKLGHNEWDKKSFTKEWEQRLIDKGIDAEKLYQLRLKKEIKELDEQINNRERLAPKNKEVKEYSEETKKLIEVRNSKRSKLDELVPLENRSREKRIDYLKSELERVQFRKNKEPKPEGKKREVLVEEQVLIDAIEKEQSSWDAEKDAARQAANDYSKMETERNRQLKRVSELTEKIEILRKGELPEGKKVEPKKDTPEIEALKEAKDALEKSVRESIAQEKKMKDLESELQRLKDRKEKEPKPDSKRVIGIEERLFRDEIEAERKAWDTEKNIEKLYEELQMVKARMKKVAIPKEKRELSIYELELQDAIKAEKAIWAKEVEPTRKLRTTLKEAQKSLEEYERRIAEKDISKTDTGIPETPELKALREKRDAKRKEYEAMKKEMLKPQRDAEQKAKILDRFRNKLKGLTDKEKEEVVRKSFQKIVESGGLDYADFKKIIADITGRGELTEVETKRLKELVKETNLVDEAAEKARTERTQEARKEYFEAQTKAAKASKELNELLYSRPNIIKRLTSIMQLNTLGIPALVNNPIYNIWNQTTLRLPIGAVKTVIDQAIKYGSGGKIAPETNIASMTAQAEFFSKLGLGTKESLQQFFTGLNRADYTAKEIQGQQIRPATAIRDLWAFFKGKKNLTNEQAVDKTLQATVGIPAEIVARVLNLGDKPQRFAAEGAQAAAFAKGLGLKDIDYDLFIDFPREEAYRAYKAKGLSDVEAGKKADYIKDTIVKEGQRSTFQQDNMLNDVINRAFGGEKSGIGSLAKAVTISPYIKIPSNAYWSYYNLINPEVAFLQSMIYGAKAYAKSTGKYTRFLGDKYNTSAAKDLNEAKYWFAHGAVGMATRAVVVAMVGAGIVRPSNNQDDTKKEREGEQNYEQQGTINVSKLWAVVHGRNPDDVKNGLLVGNRWFGHFGTMGDAIARKEEEMTPEQREQQKDFWETTFGGMEVDALKDLNQGVFGNTSSMLTAVERKDFQNYGVNLINMFTNILQPAALAQAERAAMPYYTKQKADTFLGELNNTMLSRSKLYRELTNQYPPSKIGIWGDKVEKKDNFGMRLFGISRANPDNFAQPIYEDYKKTNNTQFLPPSVRPIIEKNDVQIKLPTKDAARLEELVGQQRKNLVAPYVNNMATFEGSKKTYSQLTEEEKLDKLKILYEEGYKNGKELFLKENPQYIIPDKTKEEKRKDKKESRSNRRFRKSLQSKNN